jgi:cell division septation protein DedD
MRYRFSLGRGEAAMMLGGAAAVGVLLFATGVMTGLAFARGRAAGPPADAVLATAPAAADGSPDSAAVARAVQDSAAAVRGDGDPAAVQPTAYAPQDGIGGPAGDESLPVSASGWSVPDGYPAPQPSATRWASLPPIPGADANAAADARADAYAAATQPRVAPEPAWAPRAGPVETRFRAYDGGGGPYALQVGRYREEKAAMKVVDELSARGHDVYVYTVSERGAPMYSVRMDRYGDRASAMRAAEALEQREQVAAVVVPTEQP